MTWEYDVVLRASIVTDGPVTNDELREMADMGQLRVISLDDAELVNWPTDDPRAPDNR